jgi:hypothetical protein
VDSRQGPVIVMVYHHEYCTAMTIPLSMAPCLTYDTSLSCNVYITSFKAPQVNTYKYNTGNSYILCFWLISAIQILTANRLFCCLIIFLIWRLLGLNRSWTLKETVDPVIYWFSGKIIPFIFIDIVLHIFNNLKVCLHWYKTPKLFRNNIWFNFWLKRQTEREGGGG